MVVGSLTVECDLVIIGSGPGGYVAAIRAAQLGLDVILVEKEKSLGGVCLHWGCIPTKALITSSDYFNTIKDLDMMGIHVENYKVDMNKMNQWKDGIIEDLASGIHTLCDKHGVEVIQGVGKFTSKDTLAISGKSDVNTIKFKNAIIATGSSAAQIPGFEYDGDKVISSNEAISLQEVPKKLAIIGGGYIGTEMGTVYGKLGTEVHILEGTEHLIPQLDSEIVDVVTKELSNFNVTPHYCSKAKSVEKTDSGVKVHFDSKDAQDQVVEADKVLVVVGRKPNYENLGLEDIGVEIDDKGFVPSNEQMKTNVENIFTIGDVRGYPMLAHKATREAKVAAEVCAGKPSAYDNKVIPLVVFNDPELVSVGLTEQEAKDKGYDILVSKFPYAALGRAHMFDKTTGFIKMVADKKTNLVLGVHAVGPHVSEIVAEATLALEMGATVQDLELTIHPHPTISEGMSEVSDAIQNRAIHIYQPPKKEE